VCEVFTLIHFLHTSLSILIKLPGSLDLQPEETPGVITNWRRCRGKECEASFPGRRHSPNFDDRQRLGIISLVVIFYLVTPLVNCGS
jgi:hypothetical protein